MIIYFNGQLIPATGHVVSPLDHGFLYGHGLFETMRAYGGRIFRLDDHLARLQDGGYLLEWPELPGRRELYDALTSVLQANNLADASLRLTLSRGVGAARPDAASCGCPTVAIYASPLPTNLPEQGWQAVVVSLRRNLSSPLVKIKSANYLDNMLAKAEARRCGANEAIMLNTDGYVAEGTMCNIFLVKAGTLITPDINSGILPGITRQVVIELALTAGFVVEERTVDPRELAQADEIFFTSSIMEIIPVTSLGGRPVGGRTYPGAITIQLARLYRELAEKE